MRFHRNHKFNFFHPFHPLFEGRTPFVQAWIRAAPGFSSTILSPCAQIIFEGAHSKYWDLWIGIYYKTYKKRSIYSLLTLDNWFDARKEYFGISVTQDPSCTITWQLRRTPMIFGHLEPDPCKCVWWHYFAFLLKVRLVFGLWVGLSVMRTAMSGIKCVSNNERWWFRVEKYDLV